MEHPHSAHLAKNANRVSGRPDGRGMTGSAWLRRWEGGPQSQLFITTVHVVVKTQCAIQLRPRREVNQVYGQRSLQLDRTLPPALHQVVENRRILAGLQAHQQT